MNELITWIISGAETFNPAVTVRWLCVWATMEIFVTVCWFLGSVGD